MPINQFKQERIDFAKQQRIAERQLLPFFRNALRLQTKDVLQWVQSNGVESVPVEALLNKSVWRDVYPKIYQLIGMKAARQEYYRQRRIEGITKASAIDLLVDVWSTLLRDYALTYTYQIERVLNQTTIDIIKKALGDSYELGVDRLGRTRLFEKLIGENVRSRSLVISRTESTSLSNLGKDIGARSWIEQQGGNGYKVWLGRNDARERETHLAENNTIIPIDDLYDLSGSLCQRPGDVSLPPRERIACRCSQSLMSQNRYLALVKRGRIQDGKLVGAS